jgi:drug/metabolite transporter (DMT)-like permease
MVGVMVALWPFNLIFGKVAMRYLPTLVVASFRITIAGILMLSIYGLTRLRQSVPAKPRKRLDPRDIQTFFLLALFGVVINQGCFVVGLNYTTVGHSALIMGMGPITILILAWAQGMEAATGRKILGSTLAFAGVTVLAVEKGLHLHSGTMVGDLLTLCSSAGFALYTVVAKKVSWKYDAVTVNTFNYGLSTILILPVTAYAVFSMNHNHDWSSVSWKGWAGVAYMAVFGSVIGFLIYTWALRYIAASRMGAVTYTHPIVSTTLGILWLREALTRNLIVGGTLVLVGIYLIQSGREPRNQPVLLGEIQST